MPAYYQIRQFVLSTSTWKPITPPMDCSRVNIENGDGSNTQDLRTDQSDPETQKALPPAAQLSIVSPVATFMIGLPVCYAKSRSGAGPLIVEFVR